MYRTHRRACTGQVHPSLSIHQHAAVSACAVHHHWPRNVFRQMGEKPIDPYVPFC